MCRCGCADRWSYEIDLEARDRTQGGSRELERVVKGSRAGKGNPECRMRHLALLGVGGERNLHHRALRHRIRRACSAGEVLASIVFDSLGANSDTVKPSRV
jgi:hypothetical protein